MFGNESHSRAEGFAKCAARITLHHPRVLPVRAGANLVDALSFGRGDSIRSAYLSNQQVHDIGAGDDRDQHPESI